ncbi:MAG: c-type cytochrome [Planctomycetes bacterium]|nr:c-type cytochrome [Planctomycetota bacterium]
MTRFLTWCGAAALVLLPACGGDKPAPVAPAGNTPSSSSGDSATKPTVKKPPPPVRLDMEVVKALFGNFPSSPEVDNPQTPEKVALGRMLYHEEHLSKNGNLSCASCHDLANYGQDGKKTSPGSDGKNGDRNTPTTLNAFRHFAQFWDYRAATVEEQAVMPVLNPIEHGVADEAELVAKIKEKPELVAAFGKAFGAGDVVTVANFKLAVGAFERTLVTTSRFDKFIDGDSRALTKEEQAGLKTFIDVGCQTCHMSRLFGGAMPQKLGVFSAFPTEDKGRAKVTGNDAEAGLFKVPSLLNVEKTAPYHHDGSGESLAEVVKTMAKIQLNKDLTDDEVDSIVAFLKSLTGELPADIAAPK